MATTSSKSVHEELLTDLLEIEPASDIEAALVEDAILPAEEAKVAPKAKAPRKPKAPTAPKAPKKIAKNTTLQSILDVLKEGNAVKAGDMLSQYVEKYGIGGGRVSKKKAAGADGEVKERKQSAYTMFLSTKLKELGEDKSKTPKERMCLAVAAWKQQKAGVVLSEVSEESE